LHVSIWTHPDGTDLPARFVSLPQVEGWTQLKTGASVVAGQPAR